MTISPELACEWRQFTLLSRDSLRRLLDSALASRDTDPMQFAIWGTALAMTPPLLVAVRKVVEYPFLIRSSQEVIDQVATGDRGFFVLYGMLAMALLASMTWDALFPDRTDQEILGALPVRPRTLAAARLRAAVTLSMVFAAAINLPTAMLYSVVSSVHPLLGSFPRLLFAHVVATTAASAFTFLGLMTVRAVVAVCAGERVAARLALVLQAVVVVLMVEVFLFLPGVLTALVRGLQSQQGVYAGLPPLWFTGLFSWLAEGRGFLAAHASTATLATAGTVVLVVLTSLLPAAWMGRRALETPSRERSGGLTSLARLLAARCTRREEVRGMFIFGVASLTRSRRHLLQLSTYLGLAIGAGVLRIVSSSIRGRLVLDEPQASTLALPLVFVFFGVYGLRAAMAIPTDIEANWPFRIRPPGVTSSGSVSRLMILSIGVVPIALIELAVGWFLWGPMPATSAALFTLVTGLTLAEVALRNWTKVPFASAHEPSVGTMKSRWPGYIVALLLISYALANVKLSVAGSAGATALMLVTGLILVATLRMSTAYGLRKRTPTLDVPNEGPESLNLSEALN